jgi:hypothetical protein
MATHSPSRTKGGIRHALPLVPLALSLLPQTGLVGGGGGQPPDTGAATAISSSWDKAAPQPTNLQDANGTCGSTGTDPGNETNLRKNRTDVPASLHEVTFAAIASLPFPTDQPKTLAKWSPAALAAIRPFQGVAVSVTGFVDKVKVEGAESTNCGWTGSTEVDWHIPLVKAAGDPESAAVVVETTPRVRKDHAKWTTAALKPWVGANSPVRISGWLLLDPEHMNMIGKYRSTLWEVHPITRIEVWKQGQWLDLDDMP